MHRKISTIILLLLIFFVISGCALGKKEWPSAVKSEDAFSLELMDGVRQDSCLMLTIAVKGATHRLWRATVQLEAVGGDDGEGCLGCPFVPRSIRVFSRDDKGFALQGSTLRLSICDLEPSKEYRFRVVGKSELSTSPLVFTDTYVASP